MSLDDALARFRAAAKEELSAAWQIHVAKVEEQLRAGWREQIDAVVDQRMSEAAALVERETRRVGRNLSERMNQTWRRLQQAENAAEWKAIVEEAARGFCDQASVQDAAGEIGQAPAVATLLETKDTVVTLQSKAELPGAVAEKFGERADGRCYLFPVLDGGRVAAVLFAQGADGGLDRNGLELVAALAGATIPKAPAQELVMLKPAQPAAAPGASTQVDWSSLGTDEQEMHLRAQRFARVRVAEMRLYDAERVKKGRQERNLYSCLKDKIDGARTDFRREFLEKYPSMTDYLHREIIRTLANDDPGAMGPGYSGLGSPLK